MNANPEPVIVPEAGKTPDQPAARVPLAVDLDGTLVGTDLSVESFFALLKHNPLALVAAFFWLLGGIARLKREISKRVTLDVSVLPYRSDLIDYLKEQRSQGRRIILATATDELIARRVADHVRLFDTVLASDGATNLSGPRKGERLVAAFGEKNFDYVGDAGRDLAVWAQARSAVIVGPSRRLAETAAQVAKIGRIFPRREGLLVPYAQALRLHHWLKNLLIFVPLVLAHRFSDAAALSAAFLAFLAFGLCASAVYLINDMTDLTADRRHPVKRLRPFAAGRLSLLWGLGSIPVLLGLSFALCLMLPGAFFAMVALYLMLNLGYSFTLKKIVILDVTVLALLYTMRIMAGAASVGIWPSNWLLAFSTFLFLSLALVKRFAELTAVSATGGTMVQVRGYRGVDRELLASLGTGSGYVAVLVLVIYISSGVAEVHYTRYQLIWLLCPLLLYWISYVWLTAHRGEMHDDPLIFTIRDRISRIVLVLAAIVLLSAI